MSNLPRFSIVIPTRDRPARLETCLAALGQLDYDRDQFEIIVVDDGRTPLEPIIRAASRSSAVRLVRSETRGPAGARNTGARNARFEFLAFTDDDCRPQRDWLLSFARYLSQDRCTMVGGATRNGLPENSFSTASHNLHEFVVDYFSSTGTSRFVASNNLALASDLFAEVAGFDEAFSAAGGEDREFCERWIRRGHSITRASDAVVSHAHPLNLRSYLRQHYRYGVGEAIFQSLQPSSGPGGPFYRELLSDILRKWRSDSGSKQWILWLALGQLSFHLGRNSRHFVCRQ